MTVTEERMHVWLVNWFNANAAGCAKNFNDVAHSDTSLVLMAFDLQKLARDMAEQMKAV